MIDGNKQDDILQAIELMYFGYRNFTAGPDQLLEKRGLNRSHHRILYFIARNKNISVGELLDILAISKQALNIPLRQLISMEMVKSQKSPDDARVKQLGLTAAGKQLEKTLTRTQRGLLQEIFTDQGAAASEGWRKIMMALAEG